jgi:glycosyltransferase 2 family protein
VSEQISRPDNEPGSDESGLLKRVLRPRTALSFVVAAGVVTLALLRLDLDWGAVGEQVGSANIPLLLLALVAYYSALLIRTVRWQSLLESAQVRPDPGYAMPEYRGMLAIYMVGWYFNCLVPAKLGDAYRGYLLKRRARAPFSSALGTIFAERLVDMVALSSILLLSAFIVFGRRIPDRIDSWLILAAVMAVGLIAVFALVFRYRTWLRTFVPDRVMTQYLRLEQGALTSYKRVPSLIGLTAVIWAMEGVRLFLVSESIGAGLSVSDAFFVALLASLLTAVPLTPAGLGFVEIGIVGAFVVMGLPEHTAASLALLDRLIAYWSVLVVGTVLFLLTRWRWRGERAPDRTRLHPGS